jgi:hypothetical protein
MMNLKEKWKVVDVNGEIDSAWRHLASAKERMAKLNQGVGTKYRIEEDAEQTRDKKKKD